jgi:hypothetical protein
MCFVPEVEETSFSQDDMHGVVETLPSGPDALEWGVTTESHPDAGRTAPA